jgi:twitching motility protein PilT
MNLSNIVLELANSNVVFSDIHIQEEQQIKVKTPKGWQMATAEKVYRDEIEAFAEILNKDWKSAINGPSGSFDRPITLSEARLRCNVFNCGDRKQLSASIRRLPRVVPEFGNLGLPQGVIDMINRGKGLILTTGPTGSGKTTTQAALLNMINHTRAAHIITLEQPIEYVLESEKAIISQREVGNNIHDFASGLEAALRQKPDVIMAGEIRDRATMETALHAAESGHLVLATLHTNSAESSINKVLSFFGSNEIAQVREMLSSVLIGVISQALVPAITGDKWILAYEIMLNNSTIAKAIRDGKITGNLSSMFGKDSNDMLLNRMLLNLVAAKKIDKVAAVYAAYDVEGLRQEFKAKNMGGGV